MTPREFCQAGSCEAAKGWAHFGMLTFATGFAVYNVLAYCVRQRRESHLARNVVLYTLLAAIEWRQMQRHWRKTC